MNEITTTKANNKKSLCMKISLAPKRKMNREKRIEPKDNTITTTEKTTKNKDVRSVHTHTHTHIGAFIY